MQDPLKVRSRSFFILLTLVLLGTGSFFNQAHAGAWPVRKGKLLLSPSVSYFHANKVWDKNGKSANYPDSGYFNSIGVYLYAEYGATRRLTLVSSIPFVSNTFKNSTYKSTAQGLGDGELGARYYLFNINFKFYFAVQASVIVPLYMNSVDKSLGYQAIGGDLKIVGSGSGKLGSTKTFYYTLEAGARGYSASDGPFQLKSTGSFGINLDKENQISVGATGITSQSTTKTFSGNLSQNKDFSYLQASVSVGHTFARNFSAFAGFNQFVLGRNTGIGTNISLSVVSRF